MTENESTPVLLHQPCPVCGSSDAATIYSDGHLYCFANQCYVHGDGEAPQETKKHSKKIPDEFLDGQILPLAARKIDQATCQLFDYRVGTNRSGKPVQIATYRNEEGEVVGQKLRFADKTFTTLGKLDVFYGQHLWVNQKMRRQSGEKIESVLYVCEGEIDALTVRMVLGEWGMAVSIPKGINDAKKTFERNLEWLEQFDKVVIVFDMDKVGREGAQECAPLLSAGKAYIANLPLKDPNEMLKQGQVSELIKRLRNAPPYRPDGVRHGADIDLAELKTTPIEGYSTGFPELDEMTGGLRKRELTLLTAGTGIGKSTIAREIGYRFTTVHKLVVGNLYLEESITKTAQGFVAIHNNVHLGELRKNPELISEEAWLDAKTAVVDLMYFYDHFGSLDSANLLSKLRFMAVSLKVDFIFLDHISIVVSGQESSREGERKDIDRLMTALRSLIEETGVGVVCISHLKVADGKSHEEGGQVSLNHLRGSGTLKQIPDCIIALERDQQSEDEKNVARIRVLKNREYSDTGLAGAAIYMRQTGRLLPFITPENMKACFVDESTGEILPTEQKDEF